MFVIENLLMIGNMEAPSKGQKGQGQPDLGLTFSPLEMVVWGW